MLSKGGVEGALEFWFTLRFSSCSSEAGSGGKGPGWQNTHWEEVYTLFWSHWMVSAAAETRQAVLNARRHKDRPCAGQDQPSTLATPMCPLGAGAGCPVGHMSYSPDLHSEGHLHVPAKLHETQGSGRASKRRPAWLLTWGRDLPKLLVPRVMASAHEECPFQEALPPPPSHSYL